MEVDKRYATLINPDICPICGVNKPNWKEVFGDDHRCCIKPVSEWELTRVYKQTIKSILEGEH
jgi:hypothetical protein